MVSAVINTFNEEKNIDKCLGSIVSWVDEIIIVDMGSTDDTVKIAKKFKAKIYDHPYTGFVEPARNFALTKASGDWVLLIDADEEVPIKLSKTLLSNVQSQKSFIRIPRKNIIFNSWMRHAQWWPDYQIRFFKRGMVSWSDKIHSIPLTRGEGIDLEPKEENAIIHHNYQTVEQFVTRLNRYTSIQAKELLLEGERFTWQSLIRASTREFINRFFANEGYKDGVHGLVASFLQSFSMSIVYAKLWELEGFKESKVRLEDIQNELNHRSKQEAYWVLQKQLEKDQSLLSQVRLKIEKSLKSS